MTRRTVGLIAATLAVVREAIAIPAFFWWGATVAPILTPLVFLAGGLGLIFAKGRPVPDEPYRTPPVGEGPNDLPRG